MNYVTDGSFEGILTAVFEVYQKREAPQSIISRDYFQMQLDGKSREITTDDEKAQRVYNAIKNKISNEALEVLYKAWLSEHNDVGTAIYNYIRIGLKIGNKVVSYLQNPDILLVHDLYQKVEKESHLFLGILRFKKLYTGIYYSRIEPDNNITMLITDHFVQRLSDQPWIIHDAKREIYALYDTNQVVFTKQSINISMDKCDDAGFELLWKKYFQAIAIENRKNLRLQKQFMPRRYWKNITEKQL